MNRQPLDVEDMCKKLKPVLGQKADQIYFAWKMTFDKEKKFQIEQALQTLYMKHVDADILQDGVILQPPQAEQIAGDYPFGMVTYGERELYPFGLREKDFPRHVCITGMSGSGKTNLGFMILQSLIEKKKPFIVLDWKYSFRPLLSLDKDILLFTVGNEHLTNHFQININRPPKGVAPKEWISILADIINESFFASHGVHKLISETMHEAFREFGVYEGSENYPTWKDIKQRLEDKSEDHARGREAEWLQSALRIAHSLTFGDFGETINANAKYGMNVEDILGKKVIFELQSLGATEKKFFCEYLLTYIYKLKKTSQKEMTSSFTMAIVVDEAHNIFLKDKTVFMKESVVDAIYREIREYGISLICMDQHISKLSDVVPGNSACNIAFQQMLPQDIMTSAGVMQMIESKNYFSMLPVGSAIVRLAERYHRPFLIRVPYMPLTKVQISDEDVVARMEDLLKKFAVEKIVQESAADLGRDGPLQRDETAQHSADAAETPGATVASRMQSHDNYDEQLASTKERLERRFEKEKRAFLLKLEDRKEKEMEKVLEKERGIGLKSDREERTVPLRMGNEALTAIRGPKEFIVKQTTYGDRDPFKNLRRKDDEDFARTLRLKEQGEHRKQMPFAEIDLKIGKGQFAPSPAGPSPGKATPTAQASQPAQPSHSLNQPQTALLAAIREHPDKTITQVYKHLALSGRKGDQLKNELLALGLIEIVEERTERGWKKHMKLSRPAQPA
jgi:hypothetical protein